MATTSDELPNAWLVASRFGVTTEVWMHRQAAGMPRLDLRVVTLNHVEPVQFPAHGFELTQLADKTSLPTGRLRSQLYLAWCRWKNRSVGGFRGSPDEAAEWVRLAAEDRPRVALVQYGNTAVRMAPLLQHLGVPLVAHFHGFDLSSALRGPVYRRNLARLAPGFAACVVVAEYQRDWLLRHGCDPGRVHKIPCGAPISELPVASRVAEQPCRFLMVGRLTSKKRPDLSLRAFARCRAAAPEVRLTVVGDGEMLADCQRLATELGVADAVEWLGAQPITVVKEQIAMAGCFVQHSVTAESGDMEGWPVAIAEAAGSGLPIVSTRHASIPEQVDHEVTGLLCDELDWQSMGDHMVTLARDSDLRVRMGAASRAKLSEFETGTQVAKLEDLLLEIAGGQA